MERNDKKISVIVPAYNAESTLERCVSSLVKQTYANLEIILVDDCSNDSTPALCDSLAKTDSRIVVVHHTENLGAAAARNSGTAIACGDFIAFIDADDYIDAEAYVLAAEAAAKHGAQTAIWSYVTEYGENKKVKHIYDTDCVLDGADILIDVLGPTGQRLAHPEHLHSLSPVWNKLFSAKTIKKDCIEFTDINLVGAEDLLFNACYFLSTDGQKCVYIDRPFVHYIKSSETLTAGCRANYAAQMDFLYDVLTKAVADRQDSTRCLQAIANRRALSLINTGLNETMNSQASTAQIATKIKAIISDNQYHEAVSQLDTKPMPPHWKVFFFCARLKSAWAVLALLKIIKKLVVKTDG